MRFQLLPRRFRWVEFAAMLLSLGCLRIAAAEETQMLRVLSYNLFHGGDAGKQPLAKTVEVIKKSGAEIAGLQELAGKGPNKTRPNRGPAIAKRLAWHFFDQGNNSGVVSKYPIVGHSPQKHGVKIELPDHRHVWLFNVHLAPRPYQPHQVYKIPQKDAPFLDDAQSVVAAAKSARGHQVEELLAEVDAVRKENTPIFIVGDFNEPSEFDWTDATAAEGRCKFAIPWPTTRAVREAGFADAYRHIHPDPVKNPGITWTPIKAENDPTDHHDRIDYIFVGGAGASVAKAEIIGESPQRADIVVRPYPSDHRAVVAMVSIDGPTEATADKIDLKAWRKPAVDRRRRIIFNNDGNDHIQVIKRPSVQDYLDARTSALVGTQVDSIFYCTNRGSFGLFHHPTKVGQLFTTTEGRFADNQTKAFLDAGIDTFKVMVDFCKKNDMEIFWSSRMNDTHDGTRTDYGPIKFRGNAIKREHPEYLIGSPEKRPKYGAWSAVDYALPEVRDLAFRFVEEVCQNYDIDGVELDFFRHPVYFRSTSRGEVATEEEVAVMTELVRRIRTMADEIGQKRGRPILIAVKGPDSVEYARAIGLDIEKWMADDLFDLFIPGGYFQLNEWETTVALGRKYGVKVYASLDEPRARDAEARAMRESNLAYRGRAANAWAAGVDGIYIFNIFNPHWPQWRELGDAEGLAKLDKDYFASIRGAESAAGRNLPYDEYQKIETLNPGRPKTIAPGERATVRIHVAESPEQLKTATSKLRLRFEDAPVAGQASILLNGTKIDSPTSSAQWLDFPEVASLLRPGWNEVTVEISPDTTKKVTWTDLMLEVRTP